VCLRLTDLRGVDLARFPFDFDLTFALLLMNADGRVYHRYGARDERGADVWLSQASLERVLAGTLEEHAAPREPSAPPGRPPLRLEEVPSFRKRDQGECIHCHSAFPALYEEARDAGRWREDDRWVYPPPGRIGLDLARDDQRRVTAVAPGSSAAAAGLAAGDLVLQAGAQRILSAADLSQVLHDLEPGPATLALEVERQGAVRALALTLPAGWKRGTPLEFSWRPFKWGFAPDPGFGGEALGLDEKGALGLAPEAFAFRVTYLVTWGDNQRFGQAAERAGLRLGDVFLAAAGKRDFASIDHFHAWWRLTREAGERVALELVRAGERWTVELEVQR
jgi:hypothetical protein